MSPPGKSLFSPLAFGIPLFFGPGTLFFSWAAKVGVCTGGGRCKQGWGSCYCWRKNEKCHQGSFHRSSKGRKVNKQNCFGDLAGKLSSSARQGQPTNIQNTAGASKGTVVLQLVPRMTRKHHGALNCSSPHATLPATRFEGETREMEKEEAWEICKFHS